MSEHFFIFFIYGIISSESEVFILKIDITYTITAIIALTSLASPIIIALVNNNHDFKVKELEINSKIKQEILEKFSYYINQKYKYNIVEELELYKNVNLLYIYFEIDEVLLNKILNNHYTEENDFRRDVAIFMKRLSKQIKYK